MEETVGVLVSVPFIGIGILVAIIMNALDRIGKALWGLKKVKLRKVMKALHVVAPWLPAVFGGALGAIPWWPRPELLSELQGSQAVWAMTVLGVVAGSAYERIWKGFKQAAELRGINLDHDDKPSKQ
jgi:hypothetical protein